MKLLFVGEEASEYLFEALLEMVCQVAQDNYTLVCMDDCDMEAHTSAADFQETGQRSPKRRKLDQETFHAKLKWVVSPSMRTISMAFTVNMAKDFAIG